MTDGSGPVDDDVTGSAGTAGSNGASGDRVGSGTVWSPTAPAGAPGADD